MQQIHGTAWPVEGVKNTTGKEEELRLPGLSETATPEEDEKVGVEKEEEEDDEEGSRECWSCPALWLG